MLETFVAISGAAGLAALGWAFALNARMAVVEADRTSLKELLDAKLETILAEQRNLSARMVRIEAKLDAQ